MLVDKKLAQVLLIGVILTYQHVAIAVRLLVDLQNVVEMLVSLGLLQLLLVLLHLLHLLAVVVCVNLMGHVHALVYVRVDLLAAGLESGSIDYEQIVATGGDIIARHELLLSFLHRGRRNNLRNPLRVNWLLLLLRLGSVLVVALLLRQGLLLPRACHYDWLGGPHLLSSCTAGRRVLLIERRGCLHLLLIVMLAASF